MLPPSFRYLMDLEREKRAASSICRAILRIETGEVAIERKKKGDFPSVICEIKIFQQIYVCIYVHICMHVFIFEIFARWKSTNAGDLLNN